MLMLANAVSVSGFAEGAASIIPARPAVIIDALPAPTAMAVAYGVKIPRLTKSGGMILMKMVPKIVPTI